MFKPAQKRPQGPATAAWDYISKLPRRTRQVIVAGIGLIVFVLFFVPGLGPRHLGGGGGGLPGVIVARPPVSGSSPPGGWDGADETDVPFDVLQHVNPLIGTINGGHVFPGASLPYGMAKPVADTDSRGENAAGFVSDESLIRGFSALHDSGTGGSPSMGNFPIFVHPGCPGDDLKKCLFSVTRRGTHRINDSATASPGYFAIGLANGIYAEMTATKHTALYRFSVPAEGEINAKGIRMSNSPLVIVDLIDLANSRNTGNITVDSASGRVMGNGTFNPSFGRGTYKAYFCADFNAGPVRASGTFIDEEADVKIKDLQGAGSGFFSPSGSVGAFVQFHQPQADEGIMVRMGVSFRSSEQACQNAEMEIPDYNFNQVVQEARQTWREKFAIVETDNTGMNEELQTTFWSGIYRAMLSPQDYTGENPFWDAGHPYYDSFYCIWDSFRAQHPLLTILDPEVQRDMVRTLVDIYKHEGKLPDCRMTFNKGFTQGGSNADVVLADALLKNITHGIDWDSAYDAVVSDAEVEPKDWSVEGRGGIESWHNLGYIPWNDQDKLGTGPMSRSISRTVEYAYDDFCIAIMAKIMGNMPDYKKYLERSKNWLNLWNAEQKDLFRDQEGHVQSTNFTGFLQPRMANGTWRYQNTRMCSPVYQQHVCYFDTMYDTYEGSPWLYSFYVPQDMKTLIETMGGKDAFVERLHFFHESEIIYMGNEQSYLPVYQFHYAGRPALSSYWIHRYIPSQFNATINGIPGNDDCAMGSFTAFAFMGFFPVAGQDVYLLTPPLFASVSIQTPSGNPAVIRNKNFDPSYKNVYIQSATLNGKPYASNWITHRFFLEGGVLEYVLGSRESGWGQRDEEVPPSASEFMIEGGDGGDSGKDRTQGLEMS